MDRPVLENRDYLLEELDRLIGYLGEYREALEQGNKGQTVYPAGRGADL